MAELKLIRTNEYSNILRDYQVYVDNKKVGVISNGETKAFPIPPGEHKVVCKIDWCCSQEISIEVKSDDVKTLKVSAFKYGRWLPLFLPGIFLLPLLVQGNPALRFLYWLYIPLGAMLFYYITIGRKKYLRLNEV